MALSDGQNLTPKFLLGIIYHPLKLKIQLKAGLLRPKVFPKTSEQLQNNSQKVQKTTILNLQIVKSRVPILQKVLSFKCILGLDARRWPYKCSNQF